MSEPQTDGFIQLDRTFHDLRSDAKAGDDGELHRALFSGDTLGWDDLLKEHRVVLLAEAGAGKTEEVRAAAKRLRAAGHAAFFLRIEHIAHDLEDAFEVGDGEEFRQWLASPDEGWLLLDSVDEARLGSPKDFELAMRRLAGRIRNALPRVHLVITGRTTAWRPLTDLKLCRSLFPYKPPTREGSEDGDVTAKADGKSAETTAPFRVVALENLGRTQIERFLTAKKVEDVASFLEAVEKNDAAMFTSRPQDLEELAGFWNTNKRIGSRLEIIRASIDRRLTERDPDRSFAQPLTAERAREGARLVAAASTLARQPLIGVPDAVEHGTALSIRSILVGWTDAECAALLARPIFDRAIYGTVRFHHRSVREYLTAEWLCSLLRRQGSRRRVEELFFKEQYGIVVVVPAMRPILPWLAILDERILERILAIAPEITFEGGDPSRLLPETRRAVLRHVCEQLSEPAHGRSALDYEAVQRFTGPDIVEDIRGLLREYAADDDIVWFLLRLVSHGGLAQAAPEAKQVAIGSREKYARVAAIKALRVIGAKEELADVRADFLNEPVEPMREWLDEIVQGLVTDRAGTDWLVSALARVQAKERFSADSLSRTLAEHVDRLPPELLAVFATGIADLLGRDPLIERRSCRISQRYQWLAQFAARAAARLLEDRHPSMLDEPMLEMVRNIRIARDYHDLDMEDARADLPGLIHAWPEFNDALFWHCVAQARAESDTPVVDYWPVQIFGSDWAFGPNDFDRILGEVAAQPLADDRRVALTLAFQIYRHSGRPRSWRERMKRAAAAEPELQADLGRLLHPDRSGAKNWRRQERNWKRERERATARQLREEGKSREYVQENLGLLRGPAADGTPTQAQYYVYHKMTNGADAKGHWTDGNWESLIPEFGEEVARAFRDGALSHWRRHEPLLLSEGGSTGSTPFASILGLAGLAIEARESPSWIETLSAEEARLAVHYALEELNGFPPWLPAIYARHTDDVMELVLREIGHELDTDTGERESHYLLYDASWSGQWMWDRLGPALLPALTGRARSAGNLRYMLKIVQGSSVPDAELATAAAAAAAAATDPEQAAMWFAAWVGVDPGPAITAFEAHLDALPDDDARTVSAMQFVTYLFGNRRTGASSRQGFRTVEHLKRIFILIHRHVRRGEDIERAGKGVYSPGLRDNAQEARDSIFGLLREMPGKDAFLVLMELSRLHPDDSSRPWMAYHAKAKAEQDANGLAWSSAQFVEFNADLERTPCDHAELFELATSRLLDLKSDLENGDTSIASVLTRVEAEPELRNYIGSWCRDHAAGRYSIPQEEELPDAKRPDLRFHGNGFDAPVPVELKIADRWTGPKLFERLETQLCGDYLRDERSSCGLFVLVHCGKRRDWSLPGGGKANDLRELVDALQMRWSVIASQHAGIDDVRVIGIDLTERRSAA